MTERRRSKVDSQICEEACEWFIDCRAGDLDVVSRREFDLWLRKSPEHLQAYLEIAAIWNEGPSLDPEDKYDVDTLIAQAAEDRDNVVALPGALHLEPQSAAISVFHEPGMRYAADPASLPVATVTGRPMPHRRIRLTAIAASAAILALGTGAALWFGTFRAATYATVIGEQRSLILADGSTVALNSRSRIRVRYSKGERDVELLDGQALFHVAQDTARPFIVKSGVTQVRAVGTEFDVYKRDDSTVVTVVEGRVAVITEQTLHRTVGAAPTTDNRQPIPSTLAFPTVDPRRNILLSAGEQLRVTQHTVQNSEHPNIASATAWTQRQIIFDSASLLDVAQEFNRYNERQLILEDPALQTFHISGVFSSTDPASLIRFLQTRPGLRVVVTSSEIRIERND